MFTLFATSEAVPFCKTGGLGDVAGSLPQQLAKRGEKVAVVLPAYKEALQCGQPIESTSITFEIPIGRKTVAGHLLKSTLPNSDIPVYLIANDDYFDRDGLYQSTEGDYKDNCERFVFFSRAVLELAKELDEFPDVIHCNDWTCGLIPAYLGTLYAGLPGYEKIATLLTIHNLAYQGNFWHWDMELTGISWEHFNWREMEFYGNLNFLKSGIAFADKINTVSPRYAEEIQSPPLSCGLEGILRSRSTDLSGIINGVDYNDWNPETDTHLANNGYANFTFDSVEQGKADCKKALQTELGLPQESDIPLVGIIGRLADQKGFDLIAQVIQNWAATENVQWAILGTGDERYHTQLAKLAADHPERVAVRLEFSNALAHRIEAAADMFLMPSAYEPCGLNQLYSLRYGTVPVVRATGGLADTITNMTEVTLKNKTANGFSFEEYSANALATALRRAIETYTDKPTWQTIQNTGMTQDWSWNHSAKEYVTLYEATVAKKRESVSI